MAVSAFVPVLEAADRLPPLLAALQDLCDEVVVVVDDRSRDGSDVVARAFTKDVFRFTHGDDFNSVFEQMMVRCRGDWVLRFDDDELPSPEWTRERVADLAAAADTTHYVFPRRWLVPPGDRYICGPPHWPNWAIRMMLRRPERIVRPPGRIHSRLRVEGMGRYVADLAIDHRNFLIYDREARERKVAGYERISPGAGLPAFYLYEDDEYQTEAVGPPAPMRGPAGAFGSASPYCTDVRILAIPQRIVAGKTYTAEVEVINRSARPIRAVLPDWDSQPNRFASHWTAVDGSVRLYESERTMVMSPIVPGASERALIRIDAPSRPGAYWLQADLVEEFVAWYSAAPGAGFHEPRFVEVVAAHPADRP